MLTTMSGSPVPFGRTRAAIAVVAVCGWLFAACPQQAFALIFGGEGNSAIDDPGWPEGAAAAFNSRARVAWWEGPPFGGGEWHGEYRGDARALTDFLQAFAKVTAETRRVVLHDAVGRSVWLARQEQSPTERSEVDWTFTVWQPDRWNQLRQQPAFIRPEGNNGDSVPHPVVEIYTGGRVHWADVQVPEGIVVEDQRLETHGFSAADGTVLEGTVRDIETAALLEGTVVIQAVVRGSGYTYDTVVNAEADADGHWVLRHAPAGWMRIVVTAEGYAPRVAGFDTFDERPRWRGFETVLARSATVSGRVVDDAGQPLAGVSVRIDQTIDAQGRRYDVAGESRHTTSVTGEFESSDLPVGTATVSVSKSGYCRPGLGLTVATPATGLELTMSRAAQVEVTVDFGDQPQPEQYLVHLTPEGGETVGSWGGSATADASGAVAFKDVPPGRYELTGGPNPGSDHQRTAPVPIELRAGETRAVVLKAK